MPNLILGTWLISDAMRILISVDLNSHLLADLFMITAFLFLGICVLSRERPKRTLIDTESVCVALTGTLLPILYAMYFEAGRGVGNLSEVLTCVAAGGLLWSSAVLGKNFSVFASYREIVTSGPYAFVRHPIYLFYIVHDFGFVVESHDMVIAFIWTAEVGILYWRCLVEERLLFECSETYVDYAKRVRYRVIPGVF